MTAAAPSLFGVRRSGVLLHPTSLPGPHGSGDLGAEAYHFVDWLDTAGQTLWQVLPLNPVGAGNSPYQSVSVFAGNPLLVDLAPLALSGWLDHPPPQDFERARVDYRRVAPARMALLREACDRVRGDRPGRGRRATRGVSRAAVALAGRLRPVHGAERARTAARVDALAGRVARSGMRRHWRSACASRPKRSASALRAMPASSASGNGCAATPTSAACTLDRATCRSSSRITRPTSGPTRALFQLDTRAQPDRGGRRAARLLQRHRPALGQPALRLGARMQSDGYAWWVAAACAHRCELVDLGAHRPLPRLRGLLGGAGRRADARSRATGCTGPAPSCSRRSHAALGPAADRRRGPGRDHAGGRGAARRVRLPGHAHPAVRLRRRRRATAFLPHNYERDTVVYTGTHDNDTTRRLVGAAAPGRARQRAALPGAGGGPRDRTGP